ncbi:LysM peptidoglycan-binding domain-containing protein [Limnochorda pilosa]|uniref:LysM domain-containing protein n=1 Tax=Limnochorda pilosa TaxID=1555112 RepID=A0A0K2SGF9_LIMPI|nr:LysM peptidoglycan-binding domain-containing protein [Limnochorda pilosa]BAS26186.1 hypothetical protein LIP_0329 [Limnochorda pilosa]
MARVPEMCPEGCEGGRYVVQPGDTFFRIARRQGVPLDQLIQCNPHIPDPAAIVPGDVLCLPGDGRPVATPCCVVLARTSQAGPVDAQGAALVRRLVELRPGRYAITVVAHGLAAPESLGDFDAYEALAFVPGVITWQWRLFPNPETGPTWAGTFTEITLRPGPETVVQVRPFNTATRRGGATVLSGRLAACRT